MQRRSGTRRTCPVGLAALFLAVLSTVAGCRDLPFRRLGPALAERPTAVAGHVSEAATSEAYRSGVSQCGVCPLPLCTTSFDVGSDCASAVVAARSMMASWSPQMISVDVLRAASSVESS